MTTENPNATVAAQRGSWWKPLLKWSLCALVLGFVARRAHGIWEQGSSESLTWNVGWLILAGVSNIAGWLPSVWFWRRMMRRLGTRVSFLDAARAYYCGHLGKYIPGKAMVIVIRAGLLRGRGGRTGVAALTAIYETLTMMGSGAAVAVVLAPRLVPPVILEKWPRWLRETIATGWLPTVLVVGLCGLMLPILARLFTRIAFKAAPPEARQIEFVSAGPSGRYDTSDARNAQPLEQREMLPVEHPTTSQNATRQAILPPSIPVIETGLLASGLAAFVLSWILMGLSLGLVLRSISDQPLDLADWPLWTGTVALATVVGFAALFAPGGLGIREGLIIELLQAQPQIAATEAVAAAILLRIVWFAGEILAAGALYWIPSRQRPSE